MCLRVWGEEDGAGFGIPLHNHFPKHVFSFFIFCFFAHGTPNAYDSQTRNQSTTVRGGCELKNSHDNRSDNRMKMVS